VTDDDAIVAFNREAWDYQVGTANEWTVPVGPDVIEAARAGNWSVVLIGYEPVPREWFPPELAGTEVLCLASGGGQQGPILAAAGARVTVFDNSPRQLAQDQAVADREGLTIATVLGDMRDLSAFADASFDLVFNPVSNVFCPDLAPVWRECFRVLRPGGTLLAGFMNPDICIFDPDASQNRGELVVRFKLPYSDLDLEPAERERLWGANEPINYSHTMTAQFGGQLAAGFVITGFREAPHHDDPTAGYMPGYFATRALKPGG
jgi:SAM-dependent methyltransferase